jgi:nicotinamide mononucleotide adenylyltransferase
MTTALFLGRFQPPHAGRLLTIRGLGEKYDKVVVGVTESQSSVMPGDFRASVVGVSGR